ncbi:MAG: histidine phosphatase family protein [Solirubrobacteraceae bacterium]
MSRRIYLMRHGDVAYFPDPPRPVTSKDAELTPTGVEQARATGRALAGVEFDRVVTSALTRTVQTAEAVVGELAVPPAGAFEPIPDLDEIRGGPTMIPDEELEALFLTEFGGTPPRDASFHGGETVGSLVDRVSAAMERLYADDDWHNMLVIAHGGPNRAILSEILAGPGAFIGNLEQSPGCINIIDGGPELIVRALNVTPYDPGISVSTLEQHRDLQQGT